MASKKIGLPYCGSKNKIADWVVDNLPKVDHLYDLFCGGSSVTHAAILQGKYEDYHINDVDPFMPQFFVDTINGKYSEENRWISRDDFAKLKDSDPIVRTCWSFGNNPLKGYLYGRDIEHKKKALHCALYYGDLSLMKELGIDLSCVLKSNNPYERYMIAKKYLKKHYSERCDLAHFERLQSLKRIQNLSNIMGLTENITHSNLSYDKVEISQNSVIYCDIPYFKTVQYHKDGFNHATFYDWCERQTELVIISEYWMPEDKFVCIAEKEKTCSMSAIKIEGKAKKTVEKLFVPKHQLGKYNSIVRNDIYGKLFFDMNTLENKQIEKLSRITQVSEDQYKEIYASIKKAGCLKPFSFRKLSEYGIPIVQIMMKFYSKLEDRDVSSSEIFSRVSQCRKVDSNGLPIGLERCEGIAYTAFFEAINYYLKSK